MREEELASVVVDWLKIQNWEVYQEVDKGNIADIVAVNGPVLWVIECKVNLCADVLSQAFHWIEYAHLISVAVSRPRKGRRSSRFWNRIFRDYGIGCLEVRSESGYGGDPFRKVEVENKAAIRRPRYADDLRRSLKERQKNYSPAGSINGKRWTPFRATADEVVRAVNNSPGVTFKELVDSIEHHYASDTSARVSLRHWIGNGVIEGVKLRKDGRLLRIYPDPDNRPANRRKAG